jgi:hypothetical protein
MGGGVVVVRFALAICVVLSTILVSHGTLTPARAQSLEEVAPQDGLDTPAVDEPEVYIVSTRYTASRKGGRTKAHKQVEKGCGRSGKKRKVCGEEVVKGKVKARRFGIIVELEPQLQISDYGVFEDVRGRVYSTTSSPAKYVKYMRIGGALLGGETCQKAYADPDATVTEETFKKTHYGYSPWTRWERARDDCWYQTGHNYFKIKYDKGKFWETSIDGDTKKEL